jgi:hypothetical protein
MGQVKNDEVTESSNSEDEVKKPQALHSVYPEREIYISPYTPFTYNTSKNLRKPIYIPEAVLKKRLEEENKKKKNRCNCKKSKCLKLYCECFANGEYCIDCNCYDCSNIIGNEQERDEIFKTIKEKNPVALKLIKKKEPEVSAKPNTQGGTGVISCNCTKSNCTKKYCECFKVGQTCNEACRCRECNNMGEHLKHKKQVLNIINDDGSIAIDKISVLIEGRDININKSHRTLRQFFNIDEFVKTESEAISYTFLQNKRERDEGKPI